MKVTVAVIAVVLVAGFSLLAGAQGLRVLLHLTGRKRRAEGAWDDVGGALEDDRRRSLHNLAEVRFDFDTGKIDQADYDALRARYEGYAIAAMRAIDAHAAAAHGERPGSERDEAVDQAADADADATTVSDTDPDTDHVDAHSPADPAAPSQPKEPA